MSEELKNFRVTIEGFKDNWHHPFQHHLILAKDREHAEDEMFRVLKEQGGWDRVKILRTEEEKRES